MSTLLERITSTRNRSDVVPRGHLTSRQWSEEWGMSESRTRDLIGEGMREGLIGMKRYRIQTGCRFYLTPHYFEVKKK